MMLISFIVLFPDVFPIWAILFGSLFFLIGGGGTMVAAMVWTIIADVIPVTERTAIFYRISAVVLSFNVVVNPVAAFLLKIDPWLGMWLGFGFFIVGTLSTFLIPETLELRQKADQRSHEQSPLNSERDERQEEEENFSKRGVLKQAWFSLQNDLGHIWRFIFASKSILILLFAFAVFFPIRLAYLNILLQYMTKRFEWDWSKVYSFRPQIFQLAHLLTSITRPHTSPQLEILPQLLVCLLSYQAPQL